MKLTAEQLVRCKKLWVEAVLPKAIAEDIDYSNLGRKHLIGIEGTMHPKTSQLKTLVEEFGEWLNNKMPQEIIDAACKEPKQLQGKNALKLAPRRCAFLEWACLNKLPVSCRNQNLIPNICAYTQDRAVWQQCATVQEKQLSEFENWAARNPQFNCNQLQHYAVKLKINYLCELCGGVNKWQKKHQKK